jgi:hypothetical protein
VTRLGRERAARRQALRAARTRGGQGRLADALARSYTVAAAAQAAAPATLVVAQANAELVGELRGVAGAYRSAAAAARAGDAGAYDRARAAVARGERRLEARLARLGDLGDYSGG